MRQRLEEVFEQAVWRQPSVVLLDDLDHIAGAATSAEQEHGAEAVLRQHVAQSMTPLQPSMFILQPLLSSDFSL